MNITINNFTEYPLDIIQSLTKCLYVNKQTSRSFEVPYGTIVSIHILLPSNDEMLIKLKMNDKIEIYNDENTYTGPTPWMIIDNHSVTLQAFSITYSDQSEYEIMTREEYQDYLENLSQMMTNIEKEIQLLTERIDRLDQQDDSICVIL